MEDQKSCLLLGVFHSRKFDDRVAGKEPNRGQLFRDGVRSKALEDDGFIVRSLDNKHHETDVKSGDEIHCNANFADSRRMSKALRSAFGDDIIFDHVILDYFFSPIGWARERWTANFWRNTLAMLAENNLLQKGGKLWLPNLGCVQDSIDTFRSEIIKYYVIEAVDDPLDNPLYKASEKVTSELLRCPDALTNETQLRPLLSYSKSPFLVLTRRHELYYETTCVTPSKRDRAVRASKHEIITPRNLTVSYEELSDSKKISEKEASPSKRRNVKKESTPQILSSIKSKAINNSPARSTSRRIPIVEY